MTDTSPHVFPHPADYFPGMSLRDWFAGQALAGLLVSVGGSPAVNIVRWAYETADAMLAERAKP